MTDPTIILAIRHGHTALNNPADPRVRAWEDIPLAAEGHIDAARAAGVIKPYGVQHIFSSDFMRDSQTAQDIAAFVHAPIETMYGLRTWNLGHFSGQPERKVNPQILYYMQHPWKQVPNGDSYEDWRYNFMRAYHQIVDRARTLQIPVAIISHGRNLAQLHAHYHGVSPEQAQMPLPGGVVLIHDHGDLSPMPSDFEFLTETEPALRDV